MKMTSLLRRTATLGLVGSVVLTTWLGFTLKAFGLPEEQISKILSPIPVFTIADEQGAPLVAIQEETKEKYTGVFVSKQDAQEFFNQLQKDKPDIAKQVKVQPVSLAEVYKLALANANKPDGLKFQYVPTSEEVQSAQALLKPEGQEYRGGVPLFVAKGGPEDGYLTIQASDNETVIPFFFEKSQIQAMVERFKKEKPDMAGSIKIEVVLLENIMATLKKSDDETLTKIRFVPSEETQVFIRQAIESQKK